jgi:adenylate cyclase
MLCISITSNQQTRDLEHGDGPIEFGRGPGSSVPRQIIEDRKVSRDHLRVQETGNGQIRLDNLSARNPVCFPDGTTIPPGNARDARLPISVRIGDTIVDFTLKGSAAAQPDQENSFEVSLALEDEGYQSLEPVHSGSKVKALSGPAAEEPAPTPQTVAHWIETILALQRLETSPSEFYSETARALAGVIGLDVALVLLRDDKNWKVAARSATTDELRPRPGQGREFSQTILRYVLQKKQTFFQHSKSVLTESLLTVDAVVVSPIFGLHEEVVGALYGVRWARGDGQSAKILPMEAQLVQLLAAAVGAYVARTEATRTRTQFEQFFSAELVRELQRDSGLLAGRDLEVTILISDLRNFASLSEHLGSEDTCRLIRDVMECQSQRIHQHSGVIVSYLGDGILAMWNAPALQEDHASLACRAALAIQEDLTSLNAVWQQHLGRPLEIGIGINTGRAQVGNIGSSRKFMYGPLGNTVNVASRVAGATKYLHIPILITRSTRDLTDSAFATRRLCQVRVVGIQEPVNLFELHGLVASAEWRSFCDTYENALGSFEKGDWLQACQMLLPLLERSRGDGHDQPTLKLMNRSWSCLESPPETFVPVLELSTK